MTQILYFISVSMAVLLMSLANAQDVSEILSSEDLQTIHFQPELLIQNLRPSVTASLEEAIEDGWVHAELQKAPGSGLAPWELEEARTDFFRRTPPQSIAFRLASQVHRELLGPLESVDEASTLKRDPRFERILTYLQRDYGADLSQTLVFYDLSPGGAPSGEMGPFFFRPSQDSTLKVTEKLQLRLLGTNVAIAEALQEELGFSEFLRILDSAGPRDDPFSPKTEAKIVEAVIGRTQTTHSEPMRFLWVEYGMQFPEIFATLLETNEADRHPEWVSMFGRYYETVVKEQEELHARLIESHGPDYVDYLQACLNSGGVLTQIDQACRCGAAEKQEYFDPFTYECIRGSLTERS